MKFCPECGAKVEGLKFCPECGYKLDGSQEPVPATPKPAVSDQDITLYSVDGSTPILLIKRVKNPIDIKEAIRSAMRAAKDKMHVTYRENF